MKQSPVKIVYRRNKPNDDEIVAMHNFSEVLKGAGAAAVIRSQFWRNLSWIGSAVVISGSLAYFFLRSGNEKEITQNQPVFQEQRVSTPATGDKPSGIDRLQKNKSTETAATSTEKRTPSTSLSRPAVINPEETTEELPIIITRETTLDMPTETAQPDYSALQAEIAVLKEYLTLLKSQAPQAPSAANQLRPRFEINVVAEEFPEFKDFSSVVFEVSEENKQFTTSYYQVVWNDIQLNRQENGEYELTLTRLVKDDFLDEPDHTETIRLVVYPVLEGIHLEKALLEYDEELARWNRELQQTEDAIAEKSRLIQSTH